LITNRLLDISQKGRFAISFEVNDKDFFIRVYKNNGDVLEDIRFASQGETSLTSLSLSLALMQQSMNKYNIFLLDELDGALDTSNRRAFIEMVNAQIKELNAEQVFIISHNNEFDSYPIDMILLANHGVDINNKDFMSNKNIIFKA
jgi:DNA repair exonuclease SbcCD ATPase subunit